MRLFAVALMMLAMLASAYAQGMGGGRGSGGKERRAKPDQDQRSDEHKKSDDKAYKSALDKIQPAEQKPDPWKNMR
jgi:hypothetical protein